MKISLATSHTTPLLLSVLALTSALFLGAIVHHAAANEGSGTVTATPATFTNYELAGNPFVTGFSTGVTCPNSNGSCNNTAAEPAIRADKSGNFYGSSENVFLVVGGMVGGTFAFKSTDGGAHYTTLTSPDTVSQGRPGVSASGGDTDLAVAPQKNGNGFYNVYVGSLQSSLANIVVSTSQNGGASWTINPTGASIPVDDREWLAADGANKVCLSYHSLTTTDDIIVDCSYNAGLAFTQHASAFEPTKAPYLAELNNQIGNLAIDPRNHVIYQSFSSVDSLADSIACGTACHTHTVWVGVSLDGGLTFTDYIVHDGPVNVDYGHQFVNVSVDNAGNVYLVYNDNHNLYYSYSTTFGQTWSAPIQINKSPSATAIFPWASALGNGGLDVVWYGTSYYDGINPPDSYPSSAAWYVYFSQNLQATTPGSSWTQVQASGIIHYGNVCEQGTGCTSTQNRDLLDDFGVAASPTTGLASIIYTSDQYVGTALEPANGHGSRGGCTPAHSNTIDCSHTDIATQIGGSTLTQNRHHFETDEQDFEEMDLHNDGGHSPSFHEEGTNTGSVAITSITATINGLPLNLVWTNSFPLQPGQTATATTATTPVGLVLAVGSIYQVTITATLADGTKETQTTNTIYTLGAGIGL
jgi:hypothetical protein